MTMQNHSVRPHSPDIIVGKSPHSIQSVGGGNVIKGPLPASETTPRAPPGGAPHAQNIGRSGPRQAIEARLAGTIPRVPRGPIKMHQKPAAPPTPNVRTQRPPPPAITHTCCLCPLETIIV